MNSGDDGSDKALMKSSLDLKVSRLVVTASVVVVVVIVAVVAVDPPVVEPPLVVGAAVVALVVLEDVSVTNNMNNTQKCRNNMHWSYRDRVVQHICTVWNTKMKNKPNQHIHVNNHDTDCVSATSGGVCRLTNYFDGASINADVEGVVGVRHSVN